MNKLELLRVISIVLLLFLLLSSFSSVIKEKTGSNVQLMGGSNAQFSPEHPASMKGNLDITIDMRFFNGKGGGSITVTLDGSAASELRRRIDSIYYLTLGSPNRNNSKVDGSQTIPTSEVSVFVELLEDRLEINQISNQYDILNQYRNEYDGIFAGVDISRKGGAEGVDITEVEGLSGTLISSTADISMKIKFGGSFPEVSSAPKFSNGEIIFYALFGYVPNVAADINETVPDIRCRDNVEATIVGIGNFNDKDMGSGDFTKYRIFAGEIISSTQTYDIGSNEETGYILYEPFNIIQSSIVLAIYGLIVSIIMLSLPRSYFKKSGRLKKKQKIHLMAIGFFIVILLLFLLGIDGWSIWIGAPVFTAITGIVAYKLYTPVSIGDGVLRRKNVETNADSSKSERYHNIGINHFQNGELEMALDNFEKALEENIHSDVIWNDKGHVLRKLERYEEALKCFNLAIKINPDYDIAVRNKRQTLSDIKRNR